LFQLFVIYIRTNCIPYSVDDDESTATEETVIAKCNEEINPGDVIFYYHELFGARPEGERTQQVMEVDPSYKMKMLGLDNMDVLPRYHRVKIVKKYINGILQDYPNGRTREIREFMLHKGHLPGSKGRKSLLAQELEKRQKRFSMEYEKLAEDEGFPIDLVRKPHVRAAQCSVSENETDSSSSCESGDSKETTHTALLMRQYRKNNKNRESLESRAAAAQEQQARDVNKNRSYSGGENLPKDTICLLTLGPDKNNVGIKNLPVMITQVLYYKASDTMRYKLCCKEGLLQGTYGRGELRPQDHLTANLMGINVSQRDDKAQTLTPYQAHDRYLKIGGKNRSCRCRTDCSKSKSCKCRKLGKLCTKHCHKGIENVLCKLCVMEN
jgi:hypothetical protein